MRTTLRWWLPLLLVSTVSAATTSGMSCNYGPRGSLTAICVNATSSFFRKTPYRFDHLDETLICQNCKLLTLEESAFDIAGNFIKVLDIRNSSIIAIEPRAFLGMLHMEKLYLSHNSIKYINDWAFEGARKIKVLEMEDALSKTMDLLENNTFRELHILEVLKLKNNSLNGLSAGTFEGLHNLRLLDLSHNHISWLVADVFKPLVNLRILVLNDNNLRSFQFGELRHLISLNLARNEITHCRIEIQPGNHLRSLILAGNNLSASSFQPGAFTNITNVEELDMSRNHFDRIPSKLLQGLYKLTDLDLSENRLKGFDTGAFSGLPHLRKLNLTRNNLDTLNITGRLRMDSLVQMDLSNNNIESFDYLSLLGRAPRLRYINLSNNSLSCTMEYQLKALFFQDQVMVSFNSSGKIEDCPQNVTTESAQELLYELQREFQNAYVNSTLLVWLFVLVTIAMLLLGVLFYVQFFILMGLGGRSSEGDIKSFTNFPSTEISDM